MKTTIDIPEPLYTEAKIRAIERRLSLKALVLRGLERELSTPSTEANQGPVPYFARRPLRPGFAALGGTGVLAPHAGDKSVDEILDALKADATA